LEVIRASEILNYLEFMKRNSRETEPEEYFLKTEKMCEAKIQTHQWANTESDDPAKDHQYIWNILQKTEPFRAIEKSFGTSRYLESLAVLARNYEPSSTSNNPKPIGRISTSDDPQTMGSTATAIDVADTDIMDLRSDYGLMAHLILGLSIISTLP
jgi:hypothetical protein